MSLNPIADAIVKMEGADRPNSVNMTMVRQYGLWNVGHLIWVGQYGAREVVINGRAWAGWPTREEAYAGVLRDLGAKARRGDTISEAFYAYAPPSENNTEQYIQFVVSQTGYSRDTPLRSILDGTVTPQFGNTPAEQLPGNTEQPAPTPSPSPVFSDDTDTAVMVTVAAAVAAIASMLLRHS